MSLATISEAADQGAVVIALSQARRDIEKAIDAVRMSDAEALTHICRATDSLVASYRAALPLVMPIIATMPDRIWNIDLETR